MKIHIHTSYHSKPVKLTKEEILNTAQVFFVIFSSLPKLLNRIQLPVQWNYMGGKNTKTVISLKSGITW